MPTVRITNFNGLIPRTGTRLLPDNSAVSASNVKSKSGELHPLNVPHVITKPNKTMPPLSIYHARSGTTLDAWLTWPYDVDVVRAPLSVDVESRFYWTGDGAPRMGSYSQVTTGGNNDYPKAWYSLGIPIPAAKPAVSVTGGVGSVVTRYYLYTYFSALGEESGPSPISATASGPIDGTWAISGMSDFPQNSGDINAITYSGSTVTITTTNPQSNRVGEKVMIAGVTTVTNVNGTWTLTAVTSNTMTFVVTTAPTGVYSNATDTTDSWARVDNWNTTGMKRRLYRTTGTTGAFELVNDNVGTSYSDTLTDSQIMGDGLISAGWIPPPVGLTGLTVHASGALAGFVGNQLWLSEPLQPHAWIAANTLSTDYPIVGIGAFGTEIAIATGGNPYVASGVDPASMSMQKIDGLYPCMSKRSVVPVGDGVVYASSHGLIYVGTAGTRVFTDPFYTRDEWLPLNPASMVCEYTNGRVYTAYNDASGNTQILVFYGAMLVVAGIHVSELYADQATGELYMGTANGIEQFDSVETYPMAYNWRSKDFTFPNPCNLGAAKIDFKLAIDPTALSALIAQRNAAIAANQAALVSGNLSGAIDSSDYNAIAVNAGQFVTVPDLPPANTVQFILRNNDTVVFSKVVQDTKAFRLPAGLKYDHASVEVSGSGVVYDIRIAETMTALKQA